MISLSARVLVHVLFDFFGSHDTALQRGRREKRVAYKLFHIAPEPFSDRDSETHLSPIDHLSRHEARCHFFQQRLRFESSHLETFGKTRRKLDNVMVEER